MRLGSYFNRASGLDAFKAEAGSAPRATVLQSLAPNVNFSVKARSLDTHRVSENGANAQSLIQPNRQAVTGVQQDVQRQMGGVEGLVRQAQSEAIAAARAEGLNAATMFPDVRMADGDVATMGGMLSGSALSGIQWAEGAGTIATARQQSGSNDFTIGSDENLTRDEAMARLEDHLRSASSVAQEDTIGMPGENTQTAAVSIDWNEFFDAGYGLDDIMYLNPQNMAHYLPEYAELSAQSHAAQNVINDLNATEDRLDAGTVLLTGQSVRGFQDGPLAMGGGMRRSVDKPADAYDNEPDPDFIAKAAPAAPSLPSGL